ncbi:hypothetical protein [Streptomyces sp. CBMA156]|uniref:hypothetical protein n=1 Tax=Streptomyces sp. CBMA156 TaxID=1930280 RepID=UPI001661DC72|nr:hypothetical protein [Streptomyces sp. CBMA156]MBD0670478.1 hypothetical protein [Streptomyces sp. CBMA156]MBD0675918.1 hypothetical protein [Streptomyces sp. CBMA156]
MRRLPTGEPVWDLVFDEKGVLTAPAAGDFLDEVTAEGVRELFVFSHGWGTSDQHARELYGAMFPLIREAGSGTAGLGTVGFAGVFWPSLWFPPTPATPPPAVAAPQAGDGAVVDLSAGTAAVSGADIAASLATGFADPEQQRTVTEIGRLIDEGAAAGPGETDQAKEQRLVGIQQLIRSLVPPPGAGGEFEDAGETALLLDTDPKASYQAAAEAFGSAPPGSSTQGIGDWFGNALNGAKDALRVLSFSVMKARAGDIGRNGLGPLLAALHGREPGVRVHLLGHSFGARLVSFALAGVGPAADSPVASLLLIQGAFSHWAFAHAQDNPFGSAGALNAFGDRVHGPLVATFSVHDWAVGIWYPKASFLARQDSEADVAGRWDGMGADGYQAVAPAEERVMPADGGTDYAFVPGTFYRVNAAAVIDNVEGEPFSGAHSDIRKPQVAALATAAAAAHA